MIYGKIKGYDGDNLTIEAPFKDDWLLEKQGIIDVEINLLDGRTLSVSQRKKIFALCRDIGLYTGYLPEEAKEIMKYDYIAKTGSLYFSLADANMTEAKQFISHLVEFCLANGIPCQDTLLNMTDDISRYLYLCLAYKKCCLCGRQAQVHHVDRIGLGGNRNKMSHIGYEAMALCAKHHREAHQMTKEEFNEKYHIYGIKLDEYLVKKLKLGAWKDGSK